MPIQRTLVLIKPHAVKSRWTDDIITRYEEKYEVVNRHDFTMTAGLAARFYREHQGQDFYGGLIDCMVEGPLVALILSGEDAVAGVRALNGPTDPNKASLDTLRGLYRGPGVPHNTVHASDSPEAAEREISLIFETD